MKARLALALLLLPTFALGTLRPPTQTWPIDPEGSEVQFSVRKLWFAHERGIFPQLHGTLRRTDSSTGPDLLEVDATVAAADLRMDDPDHRARALGPDFFDAARFPWIRFESDPFPLDKLATGGAVRGMLTLHGTRHPVTLALQASTCPSQPLACAIRVRGTILRSNFGMRALRGVLANRVELDLRIFVSAAN
ncbi:MAG: YceI family protein [Rhodanobacteraceae bacterium]